MMRTLLAGSLLLGAGSLLAAPVPKELKREFKIEGTWQMVALDTFGKPATPPAGLHWTVDGEGHVRSHTGPVPDPAAISQFQMTFDPGAKTVEHRSGGGKRVCPGLFSLDGDRLTICCSIKGKVRPAVIAPDPDCYVWTFERAKGNR